MRNFRVGLSYSLGHAVFEEGEETEHRTTRPLIEISTQNVQVEKRSFFGETKFSQNQEIFVTYD